MRSTRMMSAAVAALAIVLSACSPVNSAPATAQPKTTVKVDNRAFLDMTIYIMRGAERVRLGEVTGVTAATFVIPPELLRSSMPLRFVADPIGGSRAEISEEITVRPGDEVVMEIPPG